MPDDEVTAITYGNALREFRYDPFAHRPKEECTVGALRAEATDVDLSLKSHGRPLIEPDQPIRIIDIVERATAAASSGE